MGQGWEFKKSGGHSIISKWCKSRVKLNPDHPHLTSLFKELFEVDGGEIGEMNGGSENGEMNGGGDNGEISGGEMEHTHTVTGYTQVNKATRTAGKDDEVVVPASSKRV